METIGGMWKYGCWKRSETWYYKRKGMYDDVIEIESYAAGRERVIDSRQRLER